MQFLAPASAGAAFSFSLIVAIGAQNAFVLRQGLQRQHVLAVVAICALSDAFLIGLGVAGTTAVLTQEPRLMTALRTGGAVFLLAYGALAARRALRPSSMGPTSGAHSSSLIGAVMTCLAFTWLNPHVYLDTVVLLGTVANAYGPDRGWFAAGAATMSIVWFAALGYGSRFLRPVFARPNAWRVLDAIIALVMFGLAVSLLQAM